MSGQPKLSGPSADVDAAFADLIAEITDKLQAGEAVDVEQHLANHPEWADRLRSLLPALEVMAHAQRSTGEAAAAHQSRDSEPHRGTLGDFRLLREVGRGGMGIVYEAEQVSLRRRVALKVLPLAGMMDPRHLQRFQNEAQAAAGLHHTNIVPVYFVGNERGVHYYAMQYIEGRDLASVMAQLREQARGPKPDPRLVETVDAAAAQPVSPASPVAVDTRPIAGLSTEGSARSREYFRTVAQLGIQAAEALDHAHQTGVVHRDIKPANLLVDGGGRLWVTDFGLAQMQTDTRLTMTGDLVGTLRYMSPEQALAKRIVVDHRTDIYSLGATLYEMLTLKPPFGGADRQELLRQIAFEEPRALRRWNKAIPRELETIVLKALERNPADRYATSQELADDLRHFLEDKPIAAQRPTLLQRLWKWGRRHQAVVASAFLVLLVATVALAASTWLFWHEHAKTQNALWQANAQRDRAHKRLQLTITALDQMSNVVGEKEARRSKEMKQVRQALLDKALVVCEGTLEDDSPDPLVQEEAGRLYLAMGNVYRRQGEWAKAEEAYRKGVAAYTALSTQFPTDVVYRAHLNNSHKSLDTLRASRRIAAGQAPEGFPGPGGDQRDLGSRYHELGDQLLRTSWQGVVGDQAWQSGWRWEAVAAYRQAVAVREKLAADSPRSGDYQRDLLASYFVLADLLRELGVSREEATILERLLAFAEELLAVDFSEPTRDVRQRIDLYLRLALVSEVGSEEFRQTGNRREREAAYRRAEAAYRRAAELLKGQAFDRFDSPAFGAMVAASMLPGSGALALLGCSLEQEPEINNPSLSGKGWDSNARSWNDLVRCYTGLARVCQEAGRPADAEG
jgi:serine/threonine protein kinase